jgi:transketolase
MRFESYGWHVQHVKNGDSDLEGIEAAIAEAKKVTDKPSMIKLTTTIGFGSKLQGTGGVHGNPLKEDDMKQVKKQFGFDPEKMFAVPQEVYDMYHKHAAEGAAAEEEWNQLFSKYGEEHKDLHKDLARRLTRDLPEGWVKARPRHCIKKAVRERSRGYPRCHPRAHVWLSRSDWIQQHPMEEGCRLPAPGSRYRRMGWSLYQVWCP